MAQIHKFKKMELLLVGFFSFLIACKTTQNTRQIESSPYYRLEALTDLDNCQCVSRSHDVADPLASDEVVADCFQANVKIFYNLYECQNSIEIMEGAEAESFSGVSVLSYVCNEIFLKDQRCGEILSQKEALTLGDPKYTALVAMPQPEDNGY